MKALIGNEEAQSGVGTLIIFIALVLVAAVAAAVLIQTQSTLNAKSTQVTKDAAATIGENFNVDAIDGITDSSNTNLNALNITLRVAAGGSTIDLSKVILKVQNVPYNYSNTSINNSFNVYVLRQSSSTSTGLTITPGQSFLYATAVPPSLEPSALVRLDVNISTALYPYTQKKSLTITMTPEKGTALIIPVTLPYFPGAGQSIAIYP